MTVEEELIKISKSSRRWARFIALGVWVITALAGTLTYNVLFGNTPVPVYVDGGDVSVSGAVSVSGDVEISNRRPIDVYVENTVPVNVAKSVPIEIDGTVSVRASGLVPVAVATMPSVTIDNEKFNAIPVNVQGAVSVDYIFNPVDVTIKSSGLLTTPIPVKVMNGGFGESIPVYTSRF